ncbi:MAG TPA: fatty acid desaturase [Pirellulales bacterium]|nr:fatty acid desaturase [Pirellulales bacterium]
MLELEDEERQQTAEFSLAEARQIVRELFDPNPWIYWIDFLVSLGLGYACFGLVRRVPAWSPQQFGLFIASSLLLYRAALFIHEIVHFRSGSFRAFRVVWNLLCGIPLLLPSFTYYTHLDHHRRKHFGTKQDGEYLPLGHQSTWAIWYYLSQSLVIPGLTVIRFMLLTPLTWLIPAVRRWVHQHASSLVMDPSYVRPLPSREVLRVWRLQELGSCLFCWAVGILLIRGLLYPEALEAAKRLQKPPALLGVLPIGFLIQAYLTGIAVVLLNSLRTLGAHRFINDGRELTFVEQLLDSVNYPRRPLLTGLWAPVGLRFHALHHLFPSLPYHNLAKAHERLMAELPADSPYRETAESSLLNALRRLWRLSREAGRKQPASAL